MGTADAIISHPLLFLGGEPIHFLLFLIYIPNLVPFMLNISFNRDMQLLWGEKGGERST